MLYNVSDLVYEVANKKIIQKINLDIAEKKLHAFIGPNGSGKTTLLRLLSGELKPTGGKITLLDKDLSDYGVDELADLRAMLCQKSSMPMSFMAYEVVATGAYRVMKREKIKSEYDYSKPYLEMASVLEYDQRQYNSLSGGEGKRVDIARMLAQKTGICFLDEPTNHLDFMHQLKILELSKKLVVQGKTVIVTLHDLNLASIFADEIHVLLEGKIYRSGSPKDVIDQKMVQDIYAIKCDIINRAEGRPWVLPVF